MTLRTFKQIVLASFHLDTAYRSGFWFMVAGRMVSLAVFIATYEVIFRNVQHLAGLNEGQALLYFAVFQLALQTLMTLVSRGFNRLPTQIHRGALDQILLKPVESQLYVSLQLTSFLSAFNILPPLALLLYGFWRVPGTFTWWFIPLMALAIVGMYAIWFLFMTLAFLASQFDQLSEVFSSVLGMLQFPVQIYRGSVGVILTYILPLASMILLPVRVLFEPGLGPWLFTVGLASVTLLLLLTRVAWKLGLRSYASAAS